MSRPPLLLKTVLPGLPPSINHAHWSSHRKKTSVKNWQIATVVLLKSAKRGQNRYAGDVALNIVFQNCDNRHWDIDNRVKVLQDCLAMAEIICDDWQIKRLSVKRQKKYCREAETTTYVEVRGI